MKIVLFVVLLSNSVWFGLVQNQSIDELIQDVYGNVTVDDKYNQGDSGTTNGGTNTVQTQNRNEKCTCVPYYLCNDGKINTNGMGILDVRAGACESYLDVCCEAKDVTDAPITPVPTRKKGCGYSNPEGIGFRITGNTENEAQFGEYPWMVAILYEDKVNATSNQLFNFFQCGGALINAQVVLTAAHCVAGKKHKFKIRAGEWDTQTTNELVQHQEVFVDRIIVHPQYYAGALFNDVALLILENAVNIAENVDVVCLPPEDAVFDYARCFATGWGKDKFGKKGKNQVILKKIDLPVVPHGICQDQLRTTRLGKFFELHRSFICAGGEEGKDTCKGDGGSPLVCPIQDERERYYQAGIVAWGIGCGGTVPGVYVNVAAFRTWIDDQMRANHFERQYQN